jgi:hypothetical protein
MLVPSFARRMKRLRQWELRDLPSAHEPNFSPPANMPSGELWRPERPHPARTQDRATRVERGNESRDCGSDVHQPQHRRLPLAKDLSKARHCVPPAAGAFTATLTRGIFGWSEIGWSSSTLATIPVSYGRHTGDLDLGIRVRGSDELVPTPPFRIRNSASTTSGSRVVELRESVDAATENAASQWLCSEFSTRPGQS